MPIGETQKVWMHVENSNFVLGNKTNIDSWTQKRTGSPSLLLHFL
jgi:hypothetical protein